jgi:hypothetical protein
LGDEGQMPDDQITERMGRTDGQVEQLADLSMDSMAVILEKKIRIQYDWK